MNSLSRLSAYSLIGVAILGANYAQILADCLIQNDLSYVHQFYGKDLWSTLLNNWNRGLMVTGTVNNALLGYVMPHSPSLARLLLVLFGMIPLSILFYEVYRRCFRLSSAPALFASVLPNVIAGQDLIPIFINGSYQAYALIPIMLFFLISWRHLDDSKGGVWIYAALVALVAALFSTEAAVFLCLPILVALYQTTTDRGRLARLAIYSFALIGLRLVVYFFQPKTIANQVVAATDYDRRLGLWINSFSPGGIPASYLFGVFIALMAAAVILLLVAYLRRGHSGQADDPGRVERARWVPVLTFAVLWTVCAGVPYVLLSSHPFSSRYGYYSAFGVALLFVAIPYYLAEGHGRLLKFLSFIFAVALLWSGWSKVRTTERVYGPIVRTSDALSGELAKWNFPPNSQIIIACPRAGILRTGSVWPWSTGFLQHVMDRHDVSGLVGVARTYYDPFTAWRGDWGDTMIGLDPRKPLFAFGCFGNGPQLRPMTHLVQWAGATPDGAWQIYSLDKNSGEMAVYASGAGRTEFDAKVLELSRYGVSKEAIYGTE